MIESNNKELEYIIKFMSEELHKVLIVDLQKDSYESIKTEVSEKTEAKGYSESFSKWITNFADSGQVHPADIKNYKEKTNLEYIKNFFLKRRKEARY